MAGRQAGVYDDVQDWKDIVWISGYDNHAVGIRKNGTLATAGTDEDGELGCAGSVERDAGGHGISPHGRLDSRTAWYIFEAIPSMIETTASSGRMSKSCSAGTTILRWFLTMVRWPRWGTTVFNECDVDSVNGAIGGAVASGTTYVLKLRSYGHPIRGGLVRRGRRSRFGRDIIYVDGGDRHTVGLTSRGTVEATGDNAKNQLDAKYWKDMVCNLRRTVSHDWHRYIRHHTHSGSRRSRLLCRRRRLHLAVIHFIFVHFFLMLLKSGVFELVSNTHMRMDIPCKSKISHASPDLKSFPASASASSGCFACLLPPLI